MPELHLGDGPTSLRLSSGDQIAFEGDTGMDEFMVALKLSPLLIIRRERTCVLYGAMPIGYEGAWRGYS